MKWQFIKYAGSFAIKEKIDGRYHIFTINALYISDGVMFAEKQDGDLYHLPLVCSQNPSHYSKHVLNFHNYEQDIDYDCELHDWEIIDNIVYGKRSTGALWMTSPIRSYIFFKDSITVVTKNNSFYTLYFRDSKHESFMIEVSML